jgi:hypothetical protein
MLKSYNFFDRLYSNLESSTGIGCQYNRAALINCRRPTLGKQRTVLLLIAFLGLKPSPWKKPGTGSPKRI